MNQICRNIICLPFSTYLTCYFRCILEVTVHQFYCYCDLHTLSNYYINLMLVHMRLQRLLYSDNVKAVTCSWLGTVSVESVLCDAQRRASVARRQVADAGIQPATLVSISPVDSDTWRQILTRISAARWCHVPRVSHSANGALVKVGRPANAHWHIHNVSLHDKSFIRIWDTRTYVIILYDYLFTNKLWHACCTSGIFL